MKLIKVKCFKGLKVEVEDLGTQAANCPSICPLKMSNKCSNDSFRYNIVLNPKVKVDIPYQKANEATESKVQEKNFIDEKPTNVQSSFDEISNEDQYDPFGEQVDDYNPFMEVNPINEEVIKETKEQDESILSKYNNVINNSIFNGIEINKDQPCFKDGHLVFYETLHFNSAGNSRKALRHIFNHWYVSKVFSRDEKSFTTDFLRLLKIRGFASCEKELLDILNNNNLNINQKFFRIFYNIIYKDEMTHFYWNNGDSIFVSIMPKFDDEADLIKKLITDQSFFNIIKDCFEEVLMYLKTTKEDFFEKLPLIIADKEKRVCYFSEEKGIYRLNDLGTINSFVMDFWKINDLEVLEKRFAFLSQFRITSNYHVIKREKELELLKANEEEDDGIYDVVEISRYTTSQCATMYNLYTTLLKEYIDVFKPSSFNFGKYIISKENFLFEIKSIIENAYRWLTDEKSAHQEEDVKLLFTIKSFFSRNVFSYYEEICESQVQLNELKDLFIKNKQISLTNYFSYKGFKHLINTTDGVMTIKEYVLSILDQNFLKALPEIKGNKIIEKWLESVVDKTTEAAKIAELKKLIK